LVVAVLGLAPYLPEAVGDPGKTMGRDAFVLFTLAMGVLVPLLCTHAVRWIATRWPGAISLPNKAHWWAPERRAASTSWLTHHMHGLGLQMVLLEAGLFYAALQAGQPTWPQPSPVVWGAGGVLLGAWFGLWIWQVYRRFPAPSAASTGAARRPGRPVCGPRRD
jgi:hypothetical protein